PQEGGLLSGCLPLTADLCFLPGTLPKPTIWAEPGSVIPRGTPVTIGCQGSLEAREYRLLKEGHSGSWDTQKPLESGDKVNFSTIHMTEDSLSDPLELVVTGSHGKPQLSALPSPVVASGGNVTLQCASWIGSDRFVLMREGERHGQFQALFSVGPVTPSPRWTFRCYGYYNNAPQVWSCPSDPLQLQVSGTLPKPSIWADPGHIVTQGRPVTIWCQASLRADGYYLYKERVSEPFWETSPDSSNKAGFPFASMSSHTAGRYQCAYHSRNSWSQRSDFLPLVVTGKGAYGAPSLSANPGPVVALGGTVSLSCSSQEAWQSFRLLKEGGADAPQQLEFTSHPETYHALFLVGPVNTSHAGTYRCYASPQSYPHSWSQPSDPLHLQPSLSAQPGSLVQSGDSLTLQCRSETGFGRFALTKDEELRAPQRLDGQPSPSFPLGPVSHTHGGRYRCYGGHNLSSTWSAPSAPLDILITASSSQDYTVENLIRLGMSALILVVLGVLLFQARHREDPKIQAGHRRKRQKTDFSVR
uniref:Immunoglobulin domain-containing protein n=1 Tax=Ursus maritimus TaxID=29073 RepID=A0A452VKN2_URSMA